MSENTKPENSSEEVDLGQLFKLIGDAFGNLFKFIGNIFQHIFNLLIYILLFFRKHLWKFVIAIFVGGAIGVTLDLLQKTNYSAHLAVEPNYDSTIQLYNNIGYYNTLARDKDSIELAKTFKIPVSEAADLKAFFIRPVKNEKALRTLYSNFLEDLDTASLREITYIDFIGNLNPFDYKTHDIAVVSLDKKIYKKLQPIIVESILKNPHFENLRRTHLKNLRIKDSVLANATVIIDSLRNIYIDVRLREATKSNESSGTTLYMGDAGNGLIVDESELIIKKQEIIDELSKVKTEIQVKTEIMNIVSDFPDVGAETKVFFESKIFIYAMAGFLLMLFYLLIKGLNKYLGEREKDLSINI